MVLHSPHAPGEVLRRIERDLAPFAGGLWVPTGFVGRVGDAEFLVSYRRAWFQNFFAPQCVGRVAASGTGSSVSLRLRFYPWALPFALGFPGALLAMIAGAVIPALAGASTSALWLALHETQSLFLTIAAVGLFTYASWRLDRPHLVEFVRKAIA